MIFIRPAIKEDAQKIVSFQIRMAYETEAMHLDAETVSKGVEQLFKKPEKGWYWIAENEAHDAVGCCLTLREWSDWRNGSVIWLHSVYVIPETRKSGVFKTMYAYLKRYVDENEKLRGIRLYVDKTNHNAIKAYQNAGMNGEHYQLFEWMKE